MYLPDSGILSSKLVLIEFQLINLKFVQYNRFVMITEERFYNRETISFKRISPLLGKSPSTKS
jgi:hypothetical protein